ncbi:MAG: hypothetical protein GY841_17980 [FCB group bacterium]|nr:hypothetical protein [FCB group bacterium]
MDDYIVLKSELLYNQTIQHHLKTDSDKPEIVRYDSIVCGLSWPTPESPAYYVIVARDWIAPDKFRKKDVATVRVLAEFETLDLGLEPLFRRMTDDLSQHWCDDIYTDMGEVWEGHVEAFREYSDTHDIEHGYLQTAPYIENFQLGLSIIIDWHSAGKIIIPDNMRAFGQIKNVSRLDLLESPEVSLFAINALRFAVCALHKSGQNVYGDDIQEMLTDLTPGGYAYSSPNKSRG